MRRMFYSPVVAVIMMVTVTVILASLVFILVSDIGEDNDSQADNETSESQPAHNDETMQHGDRKWHSDTSVTDTHPSMNRVRPSRSSEPQPSPGPTIGISTEAPGKSISIPVNINGTVEVGIGQVEP